MDLYTVKLYQYEKTNSMEVKKRTHSTSHPTEISKQINLLGKKYAIHDLTKWNHVDRLRAFLDELKDRIKLMKID